MSTLQVELAKNAIVGIQEGRESEFKVEAFLATTSRGFLMHVLTTPDGYRSMVAAMETINLTPELLRTTHGDGQRSFEIRVDVPANWQEPGNGSHSTD
jgi:hypothetical protein